VHHSKCAHKTPLVCLLALPPQNMSLAARPAAACARCWTVAAAEVAAQEQELGGRTWRHQSQGGWQTCCTGMSGTGNNTRDQRCFR